MKTFIMLIGCFFAFLPASLVHSQDCWTCEYFGSTDMPPICEPFECPPLPYTPSNDVLQEQDDDDDDSSDDDLEDVILSPAVR